MSHAPFPADPSRRLFLARLVAAPAALAAMSACTREPTPAGGAATTPGTATSSVSPGPGGTVPIAVFKDPNCGCCEKWVAHMAANGFVPTVTNVTDMTAIKTKYGVKPDLQSCHTAIVEALVIEGHVPASDVHAFIAANRTGTVGLTIPGMPASAPGMDSTPFQPYAVLAFDAAGKTSVFAQHDRAV
jgi:hypothetical protein